MALLCVCSVVSARAETAVSVRSEDREVVMQGIRAELEISPLEAGGGGSAVREGDLVSLRLRLRDAVSAAPVTAMMPRVWVDLRKDHLNPGMGNRTPSCSEKVRGYLQGTLSFRPDIDLNSYYILTLNNDATIGVIDPIRGVAGYSQLLAMVPLVRPGEDWVFAPDGRTLFVSMPKAGQVAEIDTETFKVRRNLDAGLLPTRLALQPDGRYLWVANDNDGPAGGVTVLDARSGRVAARLATGSGPHMLAFSEDSEQAFVANRSAGTVTVIDVQSLKKVADVATGTEPVDIAYSRLSRSLYVAHAGAGGVAVLEGDYSRVSRRMALDPGLVSIRFAPGDRWGFALNSKNRRLSVFDASNSAISYSGEVGDEPEQISFSSEFAYIRSRKTAEVTLIALAGLGKGDAMTPLRISGGSGAPGESTVRRSPADSIVTAPEGNAVLIASPADGTVVYYMEGMGVPSGNFRTYGRVPRAVGVVNRQLREGAPGVYSATAKIPAAGTYDVAFLLDSPRVVHCFEFTADPAPAVARPKLARPVEVEMLSPAAPLRAAAPVTLRFRLRDAATSSPLEGLKDVSVLASQSPTGAWRESLIARPRPDGTYELDLRPPRAGRYTLYFSIPSLQVKVGQVLPIDLQVRQE